MKIKAKLLDSIFCTSLLLAVAWPGATNAAQQAAPEVNWQTEYLPTKVELRRINGVLFRSSERAGLKVVTEFNHDNTVHFVQDNRSQAKSYEYDGRKHVVAIHRGTMKDGVFTEDASKLTLVAYDDQYRNAFVLSNGKAITVSLSRAHIRNALQPVQARLRDGGFLRKAQFCTGPNGEELPGYVNSYPDSYTETDIDNFNFQGHDYAIDVTITYGPMQTPVEQFANDLVEYASTPAGQTALAAITISTLLASPEVAPLVFEAIEASGIFYETVATGAAVTAGEAAATDAKGLSQVQQAAIQRGRDFEPLVRQAFDFGEEYHKICRHHFNQWNATISLCNSRCSYTSRVCGN